MFTALPLIWFAAAAERLVRANRLAEIDRHLPGLDQSLAAAEHARDAAAAKMVSDHLQECGYALLCNGRVMLEHGELLPVPRQVGAGAA